MVDPEIGAPDDLVSRVRFELGRGEYLIAFDLASQCAQEFPNERWFEYAKVLSLARSGSSERAAELLADSGLEQLTATTIPDSLVEDITSLRARLLKDEAITAHGDERRRIASEAARRYEAVFDTWGDSYPCINAATLWLIAGEQSRAQALARRALAILGGNTPASGMDDYWSAATRAEAFLVLGDIAESQASLAVAANQSPADLSAWASTRRQLRLVCAVHQFGNEVLDALRAPSVMHYCGHMIRETGTRFPQQSEGAVADEAARIFDDQNVGYAYGSLACGADIVIAEAALARRAELHLHLPFDREAFIESSVQIGGNLWVERFNAVIARATSVTQTSHGSFGDVDVLFDYCTRVAMGACLNRARFLDSSAIQLAVFDGVNTTQTSGTASDVARWRRTGCPTFVIDPNPVRSETTHLDQTPHRTKIDTTTRVVDATMYTVSAAPTSPEQPSAPDGRDSGPQRKIVAILFGDFHGFSALDDRALLEFHTSVLVPIANVIARFDHHILHRNTWGDGLHVIFDDVIAAAKCALALQTLMQSIGAHTVGLDMVPQLRIGAHVGPVFEAHDPIRDEMGYTGTHITRAARIEPSTPEGCVYVSETFAALVALAQDDTVQCDYVGHTPTAKNYGSLRMYRLRSEQPTSHASTN